MEKKTYDLRINSHGTADPMADGFFRKTAKLTLHEYSDDDYIVYEGDKSKYRVNRYLISEAGKTPRSREIIRFLKKAGVTL